MPSEHTNWVYVQLGIVVLSGVLGLQGIWKDSSNMPEPFPEWYVPIFIFICAPILVLLWGGVQAFSQPTTKAWQRPSWRCNPFSGWLIGTHLSAFMSLAAGSVLFLTQIFKPNGTLIMPFMHMTGGVGIYLGIKLCMKVFHWKLKPTKKL